MCEAGLLDKGKSIGHQETPSAAEERRDWGQVPRYKRAADGKSQTTMG